MELFVVTDKVFGSAALAACASAAAFLLLTSLWYVFPAWCRRRR